jgi:trigger factor
VKITVEVPFSELSGSMDAAYERIAKTVNIPGFRKGKIPARIIDQRFGRAAVLEEAVNDAIPSSLAKALVENKVSQFSPLN